MNDLRFKSQKHGKVQFIRVPAMEVVWLAGWLEGEGSFLCGPPSDPNKPAVSFVSTDEDVIRHAASLLGVKHHPAGRKRRKKHWKPAYSAMLRGHPAVKLMMALLPMMGKRRQGQIRRAMASYRKISRVYNSTARRLPS